MFKFRNNNNQDVSAIAIHGICKRAFVAIRKYEIHYGAGFLYSEFRRI